MTNALVLLCCILDEFMNAYLENKIVSLAAPLLVFAVLCLFYSTSDPTLWWILVVIAHLAGYLHFGLGFYYQRKAVIKRGNPKELRYLYILTAIAVAVSMFFIGIGQLSLLAVIAILYFIIHGTLNEHTMIEKQTGRQIDQTTFSALIFYVCPFFLLSLTHPSFFFTPTLEFLNPSPETAVLWLGNILPVTVLSVITMILLAIFLYMMPLRLIRQGRWAAGLLIGALTVSTIVLAYQEQPLHYVFLYYIALLFHFVSWSYYYWQVYKEHQPDRIPTYLRHHAYILVPFGLLSLLAFVDNPIATDLHEFLFNGVIFITMAMIHNTTSFLNEPWFKKYLSAE